MKLVLENSHPLDKCYSIAPLSYRGGQHLVVAAEKQNKCLLFDLGGNLEETIWEGPGGTMSLVPLPSEDGIFLATQRMYSPNDSQEAVIVLVKPRQKNDWEVITLAHVPFAHRFDVLKRGNISFLVISTMKSGHDHKDDWSHPGQVLACELPADGIWMEGTEELSFDVVLDGLFHNHGYWKGSDDSGDYCVVSADNGVFEVTPPSSANDSWKVTQLLAEPTSDIAFVDFDGDGKDEMITLSPFHGDTLRIFARKENQYTLHYEHPQKLEFVHSMWAGKIGGKPVAFIGHRKGNRDMLGFSYDGGIRSEVLQEDVGSTNCLYYEHGGKPYLVSTDREINRISFYRIEL